MLITAGNVDMPKGGCKILPLCGKGKCLPQVCMGKAAYTEFNIVQCHASAAGLGAPLWVGHCISTPVLVQDTMFLF